MNEALARAALLCALASCSSVQPSGDAGLLDAGAPDASTTDAGAQDAGAPDAGRPDSQEDYTFAGCDDAGSSGCPRSLVFVCALNTIRERYAACQSAADCVVVSASNCFDHLTTCPPAAVNDAGAAAFSRRPAQRGCATATAADAAGRRSALSVTSGSSSIA